jgi:hypothetical protein
MVTSLPYEMYQAFDKIPLKSATSPIPHPDGTFSVFFVEDFEKGKIGAFSSLRDEVASWYRKKNHKQVMEQILEEGREKNPVRYVDRGALVEKAGKWLEEITEMKKAPGSSTPHGSGGAGPVSPHGGGGVRPVFPHGQ